MKEDIFRGCGVEIELPTEDSFLKVKETLTRIGVASKKDKVIYQSCHILHKRGRYALCHFKELFMLDNKESNFTEDDLARRNAIANLLEEWGLVRVLEPSEIEDPVAPLSNIMIIKHSDKDKWQLIEKYSIGRR